MEYLDIANQMVAYFVPVINAATAVLGSLIGSAGWDYVNQHFSNHKHAERVKAFQEDPSNTFRLADLASVIGEELANNVKFREELMSKFPSGTITINRQQNMSSFGYCGVYTQIMGDNNTVKK